ncbi:MAG: hypothetical protein DMG16_29115, partial [Acidobacteria bacterium]
MIPHHLYNNVDPPDLFQASNVMQRDELKPNVVVQGPLFPKPVQVIVAAPMGTAIKLIGKGLRTNRVYEPVLNADQLARCAPTKSGIVVT